MSIVLLFACATSSGTTWPAPSIAWISPETGDRVDAGGVRGSLAVEGLNLATVEAKHAGTPAGPEGYLVLAVDGEEVLETVSTLFELELEPGGHELSASLVYVDGDVVTATATRICDEDDDDDSCAPVEATIEVQAD